ncbi:MAG: hypothetical protein K0U75_14015 [Actinomycetia bacterium]|nr:hypothetical protein [Actinomycetes bacterium]
MNARLEAARRWVQSTATRAAMSTLTRTKLWWGGGSTRRRLRRRLVVASVPATVVLLVIVAKLISVQLGGHSAISHYEAHNTDALRQDINLLSWMNIIEAHKVPFAQGDLAVLEGRLDDAEAAFSAAMAGRDSCDVRINLELVQETQGDVAVRYRDKDRARGRYTTALALVQGARPNCFADNNDPNPERAEIRHTTEPRLLQKIEALDKPPPPPGQIDAPAPPKSNPDDGGEIPDDGGENPDDGGENSDEPGDGAPSPNSPIFEPSSEGPGQPGSPVLNDIDADRIATEGAAGAGHRLGLGGSPIGILQRKLANADATGPSVP